MKFLSLILPSCSSSRPQTLPLLCSDGELVLNFHGDLQNLYAAVISHGNTQRRKRKSSEEERPPAEESDVSSQGLFGFVWKMPCGISQLHNTHSVFKKISSSILSCKCRLYLTATASVTASATVEDKQRSQSGQADANEAKMADRAPTQQV